MEAKKHETILSNMTKEYQSGIGTHRLAKKYGVCHVTVNNWLRKANIPIRRRGKHTEEFKKHMSKKMMGRTFSKETIKKRLASVRRGANCHFWKGGVTPLRIRIKQSLKYRQWRSRVYTRDDFICQKCGTRGARLNADHIKSFSLMLEEHNIRTFDDAMSCEELWNVDNGRTLCEKCHRKTKNFGSKGRISY